ncbi:hypothetical protein GCM10018781_76610 [Kitasatospora indigofera]|uniref:Uncharacterized protein n=1 Tax=Kitasatospora indigofera TaxID=67307 RepID=A0A919D8S7_9ACTN|nr:hypothetical protein GCM10018781_76610 [Kitasatospora indigofera]
MVTPARRRRATPSSGCWLLPYIAVAGLPDQGLPVWRGVEVRVAARVLGAWRRLPLGLAALGGMPASHLRAARAKYVSVPGLSGSRVVHGPDWWVSGRRGCQRRLCRAMSALRAVAKAHQAA